MVKTAQAGDLNAHANLVSKLVACHEHLKELVQCDKMCLVDIQSLYRLGSVQNTRAWYQGQGRFVRNLA